MPKLKKLIALLVVACFCFSLTGCEFFSNSNGNNNELNAEKIYNMNIKYIGEIVTYSDSYHTILNVGTCVLYTSSGRVLTNYSTIKGAYSAKITIAGKTHKISHVLSYSKDTDFAVLQIDSSQTFDHITISSTQPTAGDTVYMLNSPIRSESGAKQGHIRSVAHKIDGVNYIQHDAVFSNNDPEGILLNKQGELLSINTTIVNNNFGSNYTIPLSVVNLHPSHPLTLVQFYEKELDTLEKVKRYIQNQGEYSPNEDLSLAGYYLSFTPIQYSEATYMTCATYIPDIGIITLGLSIQTSSLHVYFLLSIDQIDGTYNWSWVCDTSYHHYEIYGNVNANTFTDTSKLTYTFTVGFDNAISLLNDSLDLACSNLKFLLSMIETDYSAISLTAEALGFTEL